MVFNKLFRTMHKRVWEGFVPKEWMYAEIVPLLKGKCVKSKLSVMWEY